MIPDQTEEPFTEPKILEESPMLEDDGSPSKKKDKKLVFLSRSVLQIVREDPNTNGTSVAVKILEPYKKFGDEVDFKNV